MNKFFTSILSVLAGNKLNQGASVYLTNNREVMQLPVPVASYEVTEPHNNSTLNINNLGNIKMLGKKGLRKVSIASFFPAQQYSFCTTIAEQPQKYVDTITAWKNSGKPLRIMITDTNVDWPCLIDEFKHGEDDGTNDIKFSLQLEEYIYIGCAEDNAVNTATGLKERPDMMASAIKNVTIYPRDSLMDVAVRAAGDNYHTAYKALAKSGGLSAGDVVTVSKKLIKAGDKVVQM